MFELHHPKQSTVTLQNWLTVGQQIFGNMAFELKRVDGETKDANALDGSSSQSENSVGCRFSIVSFHMMQKLCFVFVCHAK